LGRWSLDRRARADVMFETTKRFAQAGITHVCDLLKGTEAGEELKIMTYRDVTRKLHGTPPFSPEEYRSLVESMPSLKIACYATSIKLNGKTPPRYGY
jgi:hypothetical protein